MAGKSKHRAAAEAVQERYAAKKAAITANVDLSEEGRHRQLADAHAAAKRDVARHAAAERQELATRKTSLERELFGARHSQGQDAISARDASDRAGQVKSPTEAMDLLERAEAAGDDVLARAVARVCESRNGSGVRKVDEQWSGVLSAFITRRPHLVPVVDQLAEIEQASQGELFGPFSVPAPFGVPPQVLNTADPDRRPEPVRLTDGPLKNPATTTTTAAERADWYAAADAV